MVTEVSAARSQLSAVRRQARADTEKAAAAAESRTREYVDKFRDQVGVQGAVAFSAALQQV
jgi:hypothetical protein